jgi:hypothetical protein
MASDAFSGRRPAWSGYSGVVAERHTLMKIPAFDVRPQRVKILDGLRLFRMTGETVQMAAQKRPDPVWTCGGCGSPLAVGIQPGQLLGRVLRCGKCRSYNRVEIR